MPVNIQAFKSSFDDLARANLFEVNIPGLTNMQFHCKAAQIPSETVGTIAVNHAGRQIKIPGDRNYEPWTVTILLTDDYKVRRELFDWFRQINDADSNISGTPNAVKRDITVKPLKRNGGSADTYTLKGAWVQNAAAIELSSDSIDTLSELPVTFEYDWFGM